MSALDDASSQRKPAAADAMFWTLLTRQVERLLGVISIAILARLLTPGDFGVVGMAGAAVALCSCARRNGAGAGCLSAQAIHP